MPVILFYLYRFRDKSKVNNIPVVSPLLCSLYRYNFTVMALVITIISVNIDSVSIYLRRPYTIIGSMAHFTNELCLHNRIFLKINLATILNVLIQWGLNFHTPQNRGFRGMCKIVTLLDHTCHLVTRCNFAIIGSIVRKQSLKWIPRVPCAGIYQQGCRRLTLFTC